MGYYVLYFLRYLELRNERGGIAAAREVFVALAISILLTVAIYLSSASNIFGDGGLFDRVGAFTNVLSGFFVAALVAISAFSLQDSTLDEVISVGKVYLNENGGEKDFFRTRRKYVCFMFGYLVGVSLALSAISILIGGITGSARVVFDEMDKRIGWSFSSPDIVKFAVVFVYLCFFIHMCLVALRGVYYLMNKIYEKKPRIVAKKVPYDPTKRAPKG